MTRLAEMDEYDSMFGRRLVDEDFLAAGFTPEEVQQYRGAIVQPSLTPEDRAAMEAQYGTLQAPDYTMRQTAANRAQDRMISEGMDPYVAGLYSRRIFGDTAPTDGGLGIGLADLTPLGIPFGIEEGSRTAVQGYQQGDPLQMGLGALEAGLGILEATPLTATIGRGIAATASKMDPNTLYSVFGPPVGNTPPLRAPETGGGSGRPPLTFDEVDQAMREAPQASSGFDVTRRDERPERGITLYHGSPYDFDEFDLSRVGTGEGAQDLGRGFSLTDQEAIAHLYTNPASRWGDLAAMERYRQAGPGRYYEVRVDAQPEEFLDWGTPWRRQVKEGTPLYDLFEQEEARYLRNYIDDPDMQAAIPQAKVSNFWRDDAGFEDAALQSGFVGNLRRNYSGDTEYTVFDPALLRIENKFDADGNLIETP